MSGKPVVDVAPSAQESLPLEQLVQQTLSGNLDNRVLSTETHGAWQVLHGILAYGDRFQVQTPTGSRPAVEYLINGGKVDGFEPTSGDLLGQPPRPGLRMEMQPSTKIGQGHRDQWLAVLAQSGLNTDTELRSDGVTFTIGDWVRQMEYDVPLNLEMEFSWTLIALTAYRDTTHTWLGRDGGEYGVEDLVEWELQQDITESVCGGTHRLIGISMALNKRRDEGATIDGVWSQCESLLADAVETAKQNQNPDGSYSVDYHHRPGWTRDLGETLGTTGHVLEFLAFAASDETLQQPWVQRSVRRLCEVLAECQEVDLECGVLYHALHGLSEYQSRMRRIADRES